MVATWGSKLNGNVSDLLVICIRIVYGIVLVLLLLIRDCLHLGVAHFAHAHLVRGLSMLFVLVVQAFVAEGQPAVWTSNLKTHPGDETGRHI